MRYTTGKLIVPMLGAGALALTVAMLAAEGSAHAIQDDAIDQEQSLTERQRRPRRFARRRSFPQRGVVEPAPAVFPGEYRTIDAFGNNQLNPRWGAAGHTFRRLTPVTYADGVGTPAGADHPNARDISNSLCHKNESRPSPKGATALLWQWSQFLDHDLSEATAAQPREEFDIIVPIGDPWFDPDSAGGVTIPFDRSAYAMINDVRQQINNNTAYIDASMVYGSDKRRAMALRTLDGSGKLKTDGLDMLPRNVLRLPNAPTADDRFMFLAGDSRATEHIGLSALHTLFVREHNYWADRLAEVFDDEDVESDEIIYQHARAIVAAEIQAITYREFLPLLIGEDALEPWTGYDANVDAGISNVFATAANRVDDTMLASPMMRINPRGNEYHAGHLPLAQAFYNPRETMQHGIDVTIRGLAAQPAQAIDGSIADDLRNFLFDPPRAGGYDAAAINIQRGRDHGLATYNQVRESFGLVPAATFGDISPDVHVQTAMAEMYDSVDEIDAWVGMMCEHRSPGALVGETIRAVLVDQFTRLRDGDRFWYESYLPWQLREEIEQQTLATIIERNTDVRFADGRNPFILEGYVPPACTSDTDGNGAVDVQDLLAVLGNWGACPVDAPCDADTDGNGAVDVDDLLGVLGSWGGCD